MSILYFLRLISPNFLLASISSGEVLTLFYVLDWIRIWFSFTIYSILLWVQFECLCWPILLKACEKDKYIILIKACDKVHSFNQNHVTQFIWCRTWEEGRWPFYVGTGRSSHELEGPAWIRRWRWKLSCLGNLLLHTAHLKISLLVCLALMCLCRNNFTFLLFLTLKITGKLRLKREKLEKADT